MKVPQPKPQTTKKWVLIFQLEDGDWGAQFLETDTRPPASGGYGKGRLGLTTSTLRAMQAAWPALFTWSHHIEVEGVGRVTESSLEAVVEELAARDALQASPA